MSKKDLTELYAELITRIGEDPQRQGLVDTPKRADKALKFITSGYQENPATIVNGALFESRCRDMVVVKDIEVFSLCEHHLLPFFGKCHVGYIPNRKVLGLSKIARLVDMYARRLQIQENLTNQISHTIAEVTGSNDVGVVVEAKHLCIMMRGVSKQNSSMRTSSMLGLFRESDNTRQEFLSLIN